MSEPRHEKCKFVLLALVVPSSELQDLPSFTTGAGFVAANVAHFDRHLTEKQQKKLNLLLPFTETKSRARTARTSTDGNRVSELRKIKEAAQNVPRPRLLSLISLNL